MIASTLKRDRQPISKSTITKFFVASVIALAGGSILAVTLVIIAYANGALIMNGPDVVGIHTSAFGWSTIVLAAVGIIAMIGGAIGQFVAWIGAVLNTSRLEDKTWFIVLLVLGLLSFGFVAMLVYLVGGPDGTAPDPAPGTILSAPAA